MTLAVVLVRGRGLGREKPDGRLESARGQGLERGGPVSRLDRVELCFSARPESRGSRGEHGRAIYPPHPRGLPAATIGTPSPRPRTQLPLAPASVWLGPSSNVLTVPDSKSPASISDSLDPRHR